MAQHETDGREDETQLTTTTDGTGAGSDPSDRVPALTILAHPDARWCTLYGAGRITNQVNSAA